MTIDIFGVITPYPDEYGISASEIRKQLKELTEGEELTVNINSPGGEVFEGIAIYNMLAEYEPTVRVLGQASSIASVIAMSAGTGKLQMAETAMMLLHKPWTLAIGDENEMDKTSATLKKIKEPIMQAYARRSGMIYDEIDIILDADEYHSAEECVEMKLADAIFNIDEKEKKQVQKMIAMFTERFMAMNTNKYLFNKKGNEMPDTKDNSVSIEIYNQLKTEKDTLQKEIKNLQAKIEEEGQLRLTMEAQIQKVQNENEELKSLKEKNEKQLIEAKIDGFLDKHKDKIQNNEREELKAELLIAYNDEGDESRYINGKSPYQRLTAKIENRTPSGDFNINLADRTSNEDVWDTAFAQVRNNKNQ